MEEGTSPVSKKLDLGWTESNADSRRFLCLVARDSPELLMVSERRCDSLGKLSANATEEAQAFFLTLLQSRIDG